MNGDPWDRVLNVCLVALTVSAVLIVVALVIGLSVDMLTGNGLDDCPRCCVAHATEA